MSGTTLAGALEDTKTKDVHSQPSQPATLVRSPEPASCEGCAPEAPSGTGASPLHDVTQWAQLPAELPKDFHGTSHHKTRHYQVKVSNQKGYLAHVELEAEFPGVEPLSMFTILTNPNNAGVFRGVKDVGERRLLESTDDGQVRTLEVEQVGEARFLWMTRTFHTVLRVKEDQRDRLRPVMSFSLVKSDVLSAFDGSWQMSPLGRGDADKEEARLPDGPQRPEAGGVRLVMRQDVSPRGVPVFMKHLPLMGGLLRSGIQRAVCGVADDLTSIMNLIQDGRTVAEALVEKKRRAGIKL